MAFKQMFSRPHNTPIRDAFGAVSHLIEKERDVIQNLPAVKAAEHLEELAKQEVEKIHEGVERAKENAKEAIEDFKEGVEKIEEGIGRGIHNAEDGISKFIKNLTGKGKNILDDIEFGLVIFIGGLIYLTYTNRENIRRGVAAAAPLAGAAIGGPAGAAVGAGVGNVIGGN